MVFRVFDQKGWPIGEVVEPVSAPEVGVGARTVLLVRGEKCYFPPSTRCCASSSHSWRSITYISRSAT